MHRRKGTTRAGPRQFAPRANRLNPLLLPTTGETCAVRNTGRINTEEARENVEATE